MNVVACIPIHPGYLHRLKCIYYVCAGFLLPCQHFPFPLFSFSSAFSQAISKWLFIGSTLRYVARHPSKASENHCGLKGGWGPHHPRGLNPYVSTLYVTATVPRRTSSMSLKSTQIHEETNLQKMISF